MCTELIFTNDLRRTEKFIFLSQYQYLPPYHTGRVHLAIHNLPDFFFDNLLIFEDVESLCMLRTFPTSVVRHPSPVQALTAMLKKKPGEINELTRA